MNKSGFTLIELLVTIVIIGVLSLIGYVSITKIVDKSQNNDCKNLINTINAATKEYISENRYTSLFTQNVISNKLTISAKTLSDNKYLTNKIINPYDKTDININNITIEIELNNDYTYKKSIVKLNNHEITCLEKMY